MKWEQLQEEGKQPVGAEKNGQESHDGGLQEIKVDLGKVSGENME